MSKPSASLLQTTISYQETASKTACGRQEIRSEESSAVQVHITTKCYCNANLASSATSYLSSCAIKYCTSEPDAATAVNVYAGYYSGAGYPIGEANVATQTTTQNAGGDAVTKTSLTIVTATSVSPTISAGTSASHHTRGVVLGGSGSTTLITGPTTAKGPSATVIVNKFSTLWTTVPPTGTANARLSGSGGSGYSTSDKIALGVGIGFGVPATLAAVFMCVRGFRGQHV
ncbi:hypothetical protein DL95DRAFT_471332 [Leptodontidium sp. 2 PMI_412]|nr:hypothetical protein DL95DRAFT_471332 [Leptodontidium sp. 2 PMI_412]